MKRYLAFSMLVLFTVAVIAPHSYAEAYKYPTGGTVVKAKAMGIDQLFVCTAEVPTIFVEAPVTYAPAKDVVVVAPAKAVVATSNSPPANR